MLCGYWTCFLHSYKGGGGGGGGGVQTLEWTTGMANSLGQLDMQFQPGYEGLIGHSET